MGMARYVVDAVLLEGRSAREVARAHGISKTWIWICGLVRRYRVGGYEALEPRSRRPRSCKHETPPAMVEAIVELRSELERHRGASVGCALSVEFCLQSGEPVRDERVSVGPEVGYDRGKVRALRIERFSDGDDLAAHVPLRLCDACA
jgi:hypothetical protein